MWEGRTRRNGNQAPHLAGQKPSPLSEARILAPAPMPASCQCRSHCGSRHGIPPAMCFHRTCHAHRGLSAHPNGSSTGGQQHRVPLIHRALPNSGLKPASPHGHACPHHGPASSPCCPKVQEPRVASKVSSGRVEHNP